MPGYHFLVESYKSPDPNLAAPHSWVVHEQTKTNKQTKPKHCGCGFRWLSNKNKTVMSRITAAIMFLSKWMMYLFCEELKQN